MDIETPLMTQDRLRMITHSLEETINQIRRWNLLQQPESFVCEKEDCPKYDQRMNWIADKQRSQLGKFRCSKCEATKSLTYNSIFYKSRLTLQQLFRILFIGFLENTPSSVLANQINVDRHTISKMYQYCRNRISEHVREEEKTQRLGNFMYREVDDQTGDVYQIAGVETDESLFTHLSEIDDVYASQVWVYGIIERGSLNFILRAVEERNSQETLRIFQETVSTRSNRRTRVFSDGATWFPILSQHHYQHFSVLHPNRKFAEGFRTTSHIEGLWGTLKAIGRFDKGQHFSTIEDVQISLNDLKWRYLTRNSNNKAEQLSQILEQNQHLLLIRNE